MIKRKIDIKYLYKSNFDVLSSMSKSKNKMAKIKRDDLFFNEFKRSKAFEL